MKEIAYHELIGELSSVGADPKPAILEKQILVGAVVPPVIAGQAHVKKIDPFEREKFESQRS